MPSLADAAPRIAALGILLVAVALSQLLRPRALPRLPWEELGQPVPGTDGSVLLLDGFLSEAEVQHILAAGRQALGLAAASPAQQARMYASTELHARDDPVLAALDERVANLSGIPVHSGEGTFRVAVSRPWLGSAAATDVKVQSIPGKATRLPARLAVQPHRQVLAPWAHMPVLSPITASAAERAPDRRRALCTGGRRGMGGWGVWVGGGLRFGARG